MRLKNSFIKLGLMGSIVALLFISCKKESSDTDKPGDKTAIATATIKIGDQDAKPFTSVPASDYASVVSETKLATLTKDNHLSLFFTDDKNYTHEGSGTGIFLGIGNFNGKGTYAFTREPTSEMDGLVVTEGVLGILFTPNGTGFEALYGTAEVEEGGRMGEGSIIVTEVTQNRVKGTFTITLYNIENQKAVISNGKFDLPLKRTN